MSIEQIWITDDATHHTLPRKYHVLPQEDYTALCSVLQAVAKTYLIDNEQYPFCAGKEDTKSAPDWFQHEDTCPILAARALLAKLAPKKEG